MSIIRQIAEFVAVLACGLFAGAAVYVSLVEHPARMACGVEIAALLARWGRLHAVRSALSAFALLLFLVVTV